MLETLDGPRPAGGRGVGAAQADPGRRSATRDGDREAAAAQRGGDPGGGARAGERLAARARLVRRARERAASRTYRRGRRDFRAAHGGADRGVAPRVAQAREGPLVPPHPAALAVAAGDGGRGGDEAHALSDRLGDDHDLAVLAAWVERARRCPRRSFVEAVDRRRASCRREAFALGARAVRREAEGLRGADEAALEGLGRPFRASAATLGHPNTMPGMPGPQDTPPSRRSGRRAPGTSSTRDGRSRSSTRCWCCSPRRARRARAGRPARRSRSLGALALAAVLVALPVPAARPRAAVARGLAVGAAARAVARAGAARSARSPARPFFTVFFWGTLYYHLRTGAPWTNFLRFWRLVLTNSDPTSGNALEQVPKLADDALSAARCWPRSRRRAALARDRRGGGDRGGARRARLAALRAPPARLPGARAAAAAPAREALARRVYVIVVDGCNRERLWQAQHAGDRPARARGHRVPRRRAGLSGAHGRLLLVDAHRRRAARARHALELRAAARRPVRVGLRRARAARPPRPARRDRAPARPVRRGRGPRPSPRCSRPSGSTTRSTAAARQVVEEEDPDLLVLQLLAADQLGHVRGVRNREYLDQLERDRPPRRRLPRLARRARQARRRDRDPDGRPRPGPRHRRPRPPRLGRAPGAVRRLGPRAPCRARSRASRARSASSPRRSRALLGVERARGRARGRPLRAGARDPAVGAPVARAAGGRCLAIVVARDEEAARRRGAARGSRRRRAACRSTCSWSTTARATPRPRSRRELGARGGLAPGVAAASAPPCARASSSRATRATTPPSTSTATASTTRPTSSACSSRSRAAARDYVLGSRFLGDRDGMTWHRTLANRADERAARHADGDGHRATARPATARSARALAAARIRHDYNYAQVLTLSLWGARDRAGRGADPLPPPHERPLVRALPGVLRARGAGGLARVARGERPRRTTRPRPRRSRPRASTATRRRGEQREARR